MKIRMIASLICLFAVTCAQAGEKTEVAVLSVMHKLHAEMPYYGFDDLERIIESLDPDVLCVELQPDDLKTRPGENTKQEYPRVVYPLIDEHGYRVYAMEPAEPEFSELLQPYLEANRRFAEKQPEQSAVLDRFIESTYGALNAYWQSPADVNGEITDHVFRAKHDMQGVLAGAGERQGWDNWNSHFLGVIETAARENPGKRVLVIVGAEHAYWLREHLAGNGSLSLLDTAALLRNMK